MADFSQFTERLHTELNSVDLDGSNYTIEQLNRLINNLKTLLDGMGNYLFSLKSLSIEEEILFFKKIRPKV